LVSAPALGAGGREFESPHPDHISPAYAWCGCREQEADAASRPHPEILLAAAGGEEVWVVEGEKDVHSLEELDKVATTSPGGAGKWKPEFAERLKGDRIRIVADDDEPGFTYRGCTRNPMQTVDSGAVGAMPSRIRSKPSRTERPGPALRSGL
jgi:hypothetical protein